MQTKNLKIWLFIVQSFLPVWPQGNLNEPFVEPEVSSPVAMVFTVWGKKHKGNLQMALWGPAQQTVPANSKLGPGLALNLRFNCDVSVVAPLPGKTIVQVTLFSWHLTGQSTTHLTGTWTPFSEFSESYASSHKDLQRPCCQIVNIDRRTPWFLSERVCSYF